MPARAASDRATDRDTDVDTSSTVRVGPRTYERVVVRTRWLRPGDRLEEVLRTHLPATVHTGDTVAISEKVVVLLTGRFVPVERVRPGRLARFLVSQVRPRQGSRGLSVPAKMQYVLDRSGRARVLAAALACALTRPLGVHGAFYRVAGPLARDLDGGRPPYEHLLFPPLEGEAATALCDDLERELGIGIGIGVAVVDLNDFGGTVRATSRSALPATELQEALRDNPMGQRRTGTPVAVVRRVA